ncbi:hypothetical protein CXB51_021360 [Gossypium anomalum]|uniref:Uncharacterized protein n=1 Tax=Gossypium anomalum TaxID=47600 RepID=A0A8J5YSF9_9ROSI|nr:hypothetical protein CXB51_021360 [Gossypium anomalum]
MEVASGAMETPQAAAQSEKAKESRTKVRYAHTAGNIGYATLNAQFAEKEGREPSRLEQFRFQHLREDGSDKLNSEAAEQVYVRNKWDEHAKEMVKDSMPTPESSFAPQDNIVLENEIYTQVFGPDKNGKNVGIWTWDDQIQVVWLWVSHPRKPIYIGYHSRETLLEEAESRFRTEAAERETRLIAEAEERFMKLTEIREAKFMEMMNAREKIEFQSSGLDDKAFSSDDDE